MASPLSQSPSPSPSPSSADWTLDDAVEATKSSLSDVAIRVKAIALLLWGRTSRRIRLVGALVLFV